MLLRMNECWITKSLCNTLANCMTKGFESGRFFGWIQWAPRIFRFGHSDRRGETSDSAAAIGNE